MYFSLRRSDATFLMLSNITGLRLHPLAPEESDTEEQGDLLKDIDNKTVRRQGFRWKPNPANIFLKMYFFYQVEINEEM